MRTDLAMEAEQQARASGELKGVIKQERTVRSAGFEITEIEITTPDAAGLIGKPMGKYVTVKCSSGRLSDLLFDMSDRAECIAGELTRLAPLPCSTLVVGLGSRKITPDSLGPQAADSILATRHIKRLALDLDTSSLSEVSVIAPGVMAQTGVEAAGIVKALCRELKPELVLVIDALACSELSHLGSTVQLCTTGISPGSGVENARAELSFETLGVPTCAIGIPTVTDCSVIAEAAGGSLLPEHRGMIVTPKDIDELISRSSAVIAAAINRALHPSLTQEELALLIN